MNLDTLISELKELLNDEDSDFWSRSSLISNINEAIENIVRIRKDVNVETITIQPASNPITLPASTQTVITIESITYQNKRFAAKQIDKKTLDETIPNWTEHTGEPEFYVYEFEKPRDLWFYPKLEGSVVLKVSKLPTAISVTTTTNEIIPLDDIYRADIINYAMFRTLSRESSGAKGDRYYELFANSLGIKTQSDQVYQKQDKRQDEIAQ